MFSNIEPILFKIEKKDSTQNNTNSFQLTNPYQINIEGYKDEDLLEIDEEVKNFYEKLQNNNVLHKGIVGFVSQFGNGKSFFLQYLYCHVFEQLTERNPQVFPIFIDISKLEHMQDNLFLTILGEILRQLDLIQNSDKQFIGETKRAFLKLFPKAIKAISVGALEKLIGNEKDNLISAISEVSEEFGVQLINSLNKEEEFLEKLEEIVGSSNNSFLVILDNLDRCQPEFVLELLVLLKRLFDVNGITFILSYDKQQIINLLQAKYGENVDIQSYIKKYISYEYYMPISQKNIHKYTINLLGSAPYNDSNPAMKPFKDRDKTFADYYEYLTDLVLPKNDETKFSLSYIWQYVYLNSTLSLRKYQQGFIQIKTVDVTIEEVEKMLMYIEMLYIKSTFPVLSQYIHHWLEGIVPPNITQKIDNDVEEMEKLHEILKKKYNDSTTDDVSTFKMFFGLDPNTNERSDLTKKVFSSLEQHYNQEDS